MILYACLLLFTALNFAFLFRYGNPDWKPLAVGHPNILYRAGTLLALGTFILTLTKNQIIAGAATFGVCLLLWVLEWSSGYESRNRVLVLAYLSVITHFESFARGVIDSKDVIFYLSGIFLGSFLPCARWNPALEVTADSQWLKSTQSTSMVRICRHLSPGGAGHHCGGEPVLANRYNKSFDTTSNKRYSLSEQTQKIGEGAEAECDHHLLQPKYGSSHKQRPARRVCQSLPPRYMLRNCPSGIRVGVSARSGDSQLRHRGGAGGRQEKSLRRI